MTLSISQNTNRLPLSLSNRYRTIDYFVHFGYNGHIVNTSYISATDLKNNISDVLNHVYYERKETIIRRHNLPIAKIVPVERTKTKEDIAKILDKYYGIWKEEPWAKDIGRKSRHFRNRKISFT